MHVVLTDLDGTVLSARDYGFEGVPEAAEALWGLGVPVVAATSKTLWELAVWWRRLGFRGPRGGLLGVIEMGGAIVGDRGELPWWDWVDPETGLAIVETAPRLDRVEDLLERVTPPGCRGKLLRIRGGDPGVVAGVLGLSREEAALASRRLWDEALWSGDRACLREAALRALRLGFNVVEGARVLHVTMAPGKWGAVAALERIHPSLRGALWIALGDSPADADMLEAAWRAFVIPHPGGPRVRPRRPDYLVAPEPAPSGWVWAARRLAMELGSASPGMP